jgi:hypothetical protein
MRQRTMLPVVLLPLIGSWVMALAFPLLPWVAKWRTLTPDIPFVLGSASAAAMPGHVRSSVYYLIVVMLAAIACALPVEISKSAVGRAERGRWLYSVLLLQQLLVGLDVIRSHAGDWWLFILSVLHLYSIDRWSWMSRHITMVGSWPWLSGTMLLIISTSIFMRLRSTPSATDGAVVDEG